MKTSRLLALFLTLLVSALAHDLFPGLKTVLTEAEWTRSGLDNGQVWEGLEKTPCELVGRDIEIQARPANRFALVVEGQSTTQRVQRLR